MRRRLFLAAPLAALPVAHSQTRAPRRIVLIGALTGDLDQRLRELGFVPARDVTIERPRWDHSAADVRRIVAKAVRSRVDVIVSCGALPTQAALEATRTIPIVMVYGGDPVIMKLAPGFARPGGNLTGLAWSASESITAKAAEIFKEAIPGARAFAVLGYGENPGHRYLAREAEESFTTMGLRYVDMLLRAKDDLEPAFQKALAQRVAGIIVIPDHMMLGLSDEIYRLAGNHGLPVLWGVGARPNDQLLFTFGPDVDEHERRAGDYVARILSGAKPGDLAIEQTTRITLGINLKTAQRLGLRIPASLVARADEVVR